MKLSVLIPVYNEKQTVTEILRRVRAHHPNCEIVMVDDGSSDGTREMLRGDTLRGDANLKVLFHEKNRGKGAALRTALAAANGDIVLIQDADLEYDPRDYDKLLQPLLENRADVVYGSRFLGGPHRVLFFWHYVANRTLTLLSNALNNINLTDMETCYKVFRADVIKDLSLKEDRFGFEPEITAKVARRKCRIFEVPISYYGRDYAEGKKIGWRDGVAALYFIFRYRFWD